jgi:hypothetical protein
MYTGVANEVERKPIDAVSVGSVTIPISFAPVTVKVRKPAADGNGAGQDEFKTYDSYIRTAVLRAPGRPPQIQHPEIMP